MPISGQQDYSISIYPTQGAPICIKPQALVQSLATALWLSGKLAPLPLCSGLGRCGACKVRFLSAAPQAFEKEKEILGEEAIAQHWRLACRHDLGQLLCNETHIRLELPDSAFALKKHKEMPLSSLVGSDSRTKAPLSALSSVPVQLAIDLGTTSLCYEAITMQGHTVAQGRRLNPQMGAGADVISRIHLGMQAQGKKILAQVVHKAMQDIICELAPAHEVQEIGLAANTAMTAIFLEKDLKSLAHAPYALPLEGHCQEHIPSLPLVYIPVQLAPFVGGDISAGYAALLMRQKQGQNTSFPFLMADLGTNGEFILAVHAQKAYVASVPMGPALEGIGLSHGHMADGSHGIVHTVRLEPTGLMPVTLDGTPAQKICGTGYISLIHALRKLGILSEQGLFCEKPEGKKPSPFFTKVAENFEKINGSLALRLWPKHSASPMFLYAADVEEILKVKAAFSLAMKYLLQHAQLAPADIHHIYLAGAMGEHVQVHDLEGLGFVPQGAGARIQSLGNSALEGMAALLHTPSLRQELYQWSKGCTLVKLTEDEHFTEKFMQHMNFSHAG